MMKKTVIMILGIGLMLFLFVTEGSSATYEYDKLNRLTKVTYNNGMQIIYKYDAVGNRISRKVIIPYDKVVSPMQEFHGMMYKNAEREGYLANLEVLRKEIKRVNTVLDRFGSWIKKLSMKMPASDAFICFSKSPQREVCLV